MLRSIRIRPGFWIPGVLVSAVSMAVAFAYPGNFTPQTSGAFAGAKANKGVVHADKTGGKVMLHLSEEFVIPDTPDPHWQLVDSKGNAVLMKRLKIKDDKVNRSLEVPCTMTDVAKVQIWCAFAETNLGEAAFNPPVTVR